MRVTPLTASRSAVFVGRHIPGDHDDCVTAVDQHKLLTYEARPVDVLYCTSRAIVVI